MPATVWGGHTEVPCMLVTLTQGAPSEMPSLLNVSLSDTVVCPLD